MSETPVKYKVPKYYSQHELENEGCEDNSSHLPDRKPLSPEKLKEIKQDILDVLTNVSWRRFGEIGMLMHLSQYGILDISEGLASLVRDGKLKLDGSTFVAPELENDPVKEIEERILATPSDTIGEEVEKGDRDREKITGGKFEKTTPSNLPEAIALQKELNHLEELLKPVSAHLEKVIALFPKAWLGPLSQLSQVVTVIESYDVLKAEYFLEGEGFHWELAVLDYEDKLEEKKKADKTQIRRSPAPNDSDRLSCPRTEQAHSDSVTSVQTKNATKFKSYPKPSTKRKNARDIYTRSGIYERELLRNNKSYKQLYYHYEVGNSGRKPQKKSLYIPRKLESEVVQMEGERVEVEDIINRIKQAQKKHR